MYGPDLWDCLSASKGHEFGHGEWREWFLQPPPAMLLEREQAKS